MSDKRKIHFADIEKTSSGMSLPVPACCKVRASSLSWKLTPDWNKVTCDVCHDLREMKAKSIRKRVHRDSKYLAPSGQRKKL